MARRLAESGDAALFLDCRGVEDLVARFPTVAGACRAAGFDPVREPVPVRPAAHYSCGGIAADLDGRTGIDGLLAIGEVAATGAHGANRLASNSLLEAVVAGARAGALLAAGVAATGAGAAGGGRPGAASGGAAHAGAGDDEHVRAGGVLRPGEIVEAASRAGTAHGPASLPVVVIPPRPERR
jgi:L-aspartate oxidase